MIKSKIITRIASLFLVFVMALSLLPSSVLAVGDNSDNEDQSTGSVSGDSYFVNTDYFFGWRFSLYFAENIKEKDITAATEFIPLGQIEANIVCGTNVPKYWTSLNIYDRMHYANGMNSSGVDKVNYKDVITTPSDLSILSKIPKVNNDGATKDGDLNKFFMGTNDYDFKNPTDEQKKKLDFGNTIKIANYILAQKSLGEIPYDKAKGIDGFKDGRYVDAKNITHKGVLKLHYEPIFNYKIDGVYYAMSFRDIIAYDREKPEMGMLSSWVPTGFLKHGKMTYLVRPEPHINMGTGGLDFGSKNTDAKDQVANTGNLYKNGGVGVTTGGVYGKETPQLIKTYVMIDKVDADGTVHYKKAADTVVGEAEFYVDSNGNYAALPLFEDMENSPTSIAVLNDVITTNRDLDVDAEKTEWVDTDLITNAGIQLKTTAEDIAGYKFGLVTGSKVFMDTFNEVAVREGDLAGGLKATQEYYNTLADMQVGLANQSVLFRLGAGLERTTGGSPVHITNTTTEAVEYTHHLSEEKGITQLTNAEIEDLVAMNNITLVRAGIEYENEIVKLTDELQEELKGSNSAAVGITTPANNIVLRYILKPDPSQVNILKVYYDDGSLKEVFVEDAVALDISNSDVTITRPNIQTEDFKGYLTGPTIENWVTNSEYPIIDVSDGNLPSASGNGLSGTTDGLITNYPKEPLIHNLYVEWKMVVEKDPKPSDGSDAVPEWRLSKYLPSVISKSDKTSSGYMNFKLTADKGCAKSTLSNTGDYKFFTVNANGKLNSGSDTPENMNMQTISTAKLSQYSNVLANTWFHSKTNAKSEDSIYHNDTRANIKLDGTLNMIKSKENGSLVGANWIKDNVNGLNSYSVPTGTNPLGYSGNNEYVQNANLKFGIYNQQMYHHEKGYYKHSKYLGCQCSTNPEYFYPESVNYETADYNLKVSFDRYIQQNTDSKKLLITPEVTSINNKTTLKYQLKDTYKIYPEYGMLFAKDDGDESIKWVVGDQARLVNPVVYQTLEHKVYVTANSNGTSVATDSRALANAKKIGESNKQVIYKGAGVNTSFTINKEDGSKNAGLLTAKTFTLDFEDVVKSAWGNGDYKSLNQHTALKDAIKTTAHANASEKLLIDSPGYSSLDYTGAIKNQNSKNYEPVVYNKSTAAGGEIMGEGTVVCFTHELIVRGGSLVGVKVFNKGGRGNIVISITELKTKEPALYEAILNMNLYNEANDRSKTIFSTFEHQTGNILNEGKYGMMLSTARNNVDGIPSSISTITEGKGWYSEDTTVLVIKEYVTNYNVPSISFSDKISMSVKGLDSPANKNLFFSVLGKGYTYLKYDFPIELKDKDAMKNPDVTSAFFEFSSYTGHSYGNGKQGTNYLVPNASVSDSTNLN